MIEPLLVALTDQKNLLLYKHLLRLVCLFFDLLPVLLGNAVNLLLELNRGELDVLISDVCMPSKRGTSLLEETRQKFPDIDVVLMTGYADSLTPRRAMELGACAFIQKPVKKWLLKAAMYHCQRKLPNK